MILLGIVEDNHEIIRLVEDFFHDDPDVLLVLKAGHLDEFFTNIQTPPDVLLLDLNLPFRSGKDAIKDMNAKYPDMSIIVFSVSDDYASIFKCLCDGAKSYLSKGESLDKVKETVLNTYNGGSNMSVEIARKVVDFFQQKVPVSLSEEHELNTRENQVVNGILDGKSYKMIAEELDISINTVRKYIKSIYRKLNINSGLELMNKYLRPPR